MLQRHECLLSGVHFEFDFERDVRIFLYSRTMYESFDLMSAFKGVNAVVFITKEAMRLRHARREHLLRVEMTTRCIWPYRKFYADSMRLYLVGRQELAISRPYKLDVPLTMNNITNVNVDTILRKGIIDIYIRKDATVLTLDYTRNDDVRYAGVDIFYEGMPGRKLYHGYARINLVEPEILFVPARFPAGELYCGHNQDGVAGTSQGVCYAGQLKYFKPEEEGNPPGSNETEATALDNLPGKQEE